MAIEIERKFRVTGTGWRTADGVRYTQGYLNRDKARTVRVRLAGQHAWLTIKGATSGATRAEFEYAIPVADAAALLQLCDGPLIDKTRHTQTVGNTVWEVDEFLDWPLAMAEVELPDASTEATPPAWLRAVLGREVTNDPRYRNSALAFRGLPPVGS